MSRKYFSDWSALLILFYMTLFDTVLGSDECQPSTWQARVDVQTAQVASPSGTGHLPLNFKVTTDDPNTPVAPGQVVCRYYGVSDATVNYYTCTEMADFYSISLTDFFTLNPDLKPDCSNIKPSTEYCIHGYLQPVISTDGFCGPLHNNATCQLTSLPCCNAATWKCGNSTDDCAPGNCWDGSCLGHTIYSTDGKCGYQNDNLLCAGKWGDCCNFDGKCGTGNDFCGDGKCQSGNCTTPIAPAPPQPSNTTNSTPDGTCGSAKGYICNVVFGNCCNKGNVCGSLPQDCSIAQGCQSKYGSCDKPTVTTTSTSIKSTSRSTSSTTRSSASSSSAKKIP